jgi:hypothetical protein
LALFTVVMWAFQGVGGAFPRAHYVAILVDVFPSN